MGNKILQKNRIEKLWKIQNGICWLCQQEMLSDVCYIAHPNFRSVDHIVARSKGGANNFANCLLACRRCNTCRDNEFERLFIDFHRTDDYIVRNRIMNALNSHTAPLEARVLYHKIKISLGEALQAPANQEIIAASGSC